jgi:hypothetical protein
MLEHGSDHAGGCVWNAYDLIAGSGSPVIDDELTAIVLDGAIHVYVESG